MIQREIPFEKELEKLELLLSQGQFELLLPEEMPGEIRLIYLMQWKVFLFFSMHSWLGHISRSFRARCGRNWNRRKNVIF